MCIDIQNEGAFTLAVTVLRYFTRTSLQSNIAPNIRLWTKRLRRLISSQFGMVEQFVYFPNRVRKGHVLSVQPSCDGNTRLQVHDADALSNLRCPATVTTEASFSPSQGR
jgi:hypothetical protein